MAANSSRQIAGVAARFVPPGHSSQLKIIGQFSIAMRTPRPAAWPIRSGQTRPNSSRLAGTSRALSRPTNVPTMSTPSSGAASITFRRCSWARSRASRSGSRLFG
jgi:hypothetical protein